MNTQHLTLNIESVAYRGAGIARHEGCVYFVPGTCPGETVEIEIVRKRKSFAEARVVAVAASSPDRLATPECVLPDGTPVPGCVYGHVAYDAEVRYKQAQLLSFFERNLKLANAAEILQAPFASPKHLHYRNKITLHLGRDARGKHVAGYIGEDNRTIVDIAQCPLAVPSINRVLERERAAGKLTRAVHGDTATFRWTAHDGVCVISDASRDSGGTMLHEDSYAGVLDVPARGFFQVNPDVGNALVEAVAEIVKARAPECVADLYCGVGVFGLAAVTCRVREVVGYDSGRDVIAAANRNATKLSLDATFKCALSADVAQHALRNVRDKKSLVIVDPPRAGLEPETVDALIANPPETLAYVSCAPDTLTRDLTQLLQSGRFTIASSRLFDMFPRTAHFESLTVLERV